MVSRFNHEGRFATSHEAHDDNLLGLRELRVGQTAFVVKTIPSFEKAVLL
jgi:hypothetical protein